MRHKKICDKCDYYVFEPHIITSDNLSGGSYCIRCLKVFGSGGLVINSHLGITYITEGGSYVRSDGIIVLSETDYLLYLSGELDLDSLINHGCVTQ